MVQLYSPSGKLPPNAAKLTDWKLPAPCSIPGYWRTLSENTEDWAPIVTAGSVWRRANASLENWKKEYQRDVGGILVKGPALPSFVGKSAERIEEKVRAKIKNSDDPKIEVGRVFCQRAPVPQIEDLVRVRIETQFLDGVPYLARKLLEIARIEDPNAVIKPKGKLSGYFAQHLTFKLPVHFRFNGETSSCEITCEVQVATMLATLVWETSHGLYEVARVSDEKSEDWQWSPNDPRFLSRQLGHMIHLADGLFCNLRDKSAKV